MDGLHDVRTFRLGSAVRRHVLLIVIVTAAMVLAVGAFAFSRPSSYISTSSVFLKALPNNSLSPDLVASSTQINVAMETEASLVTSPAVSELVSDKLGLTIRPGAVSATVPPNSENVRISCTAATAKVAQQCAQDFAVEFLAYRSTQATNFQQSQLRGLQKQLDAAQDKLAAATSAAAAKNPPADAAAQVQLATSRTATLQASIGQLSVTNTDPGSVVKVAVLPTKPAGLSPLLMVAAALALGLGAGVALAVWRARADDRFRAASESNVMGIPLLSSLPPSGQAMPRLLTERAPGDSLHNAYRRARTAIIAATRTPSTLVVSAVPGGRDGADVAINLSLSLSRAGYQVTLVDAGIDDTEVATLLDIGAGPGLSDSLTARTEALPRTVESAGIRVLQAGSDPQGSRDQYAGTRLRSVLARLRSRTDFVIVSGPTAGTPEGNAVALAADGLVLVFPDRSTTHHELAEIIDDAERLGITMIGAISAPRQSGRSGWLSPIAQAGRSRPVRSAKDTPDVSADGVVAAQPAARLGAGAIEASA